MASGTARAKKAAKIGTPCKCIDGANEQLAADNCKISRAMLFDMKTGKARMSGAIIATEKLDTKKRGSTPTIFATYCPICGRKYKP